MSQTHYICPICKNKLLLSGKSYICHNNHTFDISKEGYVNLAHCTKGVKSTSGDSPEMCLDRRAFLERGFYEPAALSIASAVKKHLPDTTHGTIIDAGCGEGYYLRVIREELPDTFNYFGIDLAKEGIKLAAKKEKGYDGQKISFSVAGIFDLPFEDNSADVIMSVFAPIADKEFLRVLKDDALLIVLCPAEKHLFGLKEKAYETASENLQKIPEYDGFTLIDTQRITYDISVPSELIPALFGMTPYYWKSSKETQSAVNFLTTLDTPCDFLLKVYRKLTFL